MHLSRLRNMKSLLDNKTPKQYNHLTNGTNSKSKQLVSKYMEVQNENRILLKKMLSIDMKPSTLNPTQIVLKNSPSSQSLNRISRLKELIRVNQENKVSLLKEEDSLLSLVNYLSYANYLKLKFSKTTSCRSYSGDCRQPQLPTIRPSGIRNITTITTSWI